MDLAVLFSGEPLISLNTFLIEVVDSRSRSTGEFSRRPIGSDDLAKCCVHEVLCP